MAEHSASSSQIEDQTETVFHSAMTDWFLQNLVDYANRWGIEMGLTLQVSGMLVSGTLISGKKYFEEFASELSGAIEDKKLSESFYELISSNKKIYDVSPDRDSNSLPPNYIHLQRAKFYQPGKGTLPTSQGILWRGRISEVGGFHLGKFPED